MSGPRRTSAYDAVVIGAGHNGLVAAGYLARAGLRVVVLERRERIGGMSATDEILPGIRVPTLAHTVGRLRPSIVRDLHLRDHGLALVQPEVRLFAPQPDGRAITLWGNVQRTASELAANELVGSRDGAAYEVVDDQFRALAGALGAIAAHEPPDLAAPSLGNAFAGLRTGLAARARSRARGGNANLMRVMPMAVRDLVGEWFESDALRAAIAARGILYTALGPRMPGTAAVLLTDGAGNNAGLAGQSVMARGGPGALAEALAGAARAFGAEIRTSAPVARVRRAGERVSGVTLTDGEQIDASIVLSNLDPRTTLLDLLEPEIIGPRLGWRAANIRQRGVTAKVNFVLRDLPNFIAAAGDERRLRGRILIAPSMDYLELAARPAKYGESAAQPILEATIPTLVDPQLIGRRRRAAPKVRHVMSVVAQAVAADDEAIGAAVTGTLEQYAPGFADLVEARQVITPGNLESDYGATGGHPMHAEVALDQWFEWRPLHGFGRYRMPLDGLYLCGSGAHPGGGVTGAPGRLCARAVLADRKQRAVE